MNFFTRQGRALMLSALLLAVVSVCVSNVSAQGTFTDKRDGKTYKTVKIGGKTWMAENLNYQTAESWCYDNKTDNCNKYGRLYNFETASKACPNGWHLSSSWEWVEMMEAVGGTQTCSDCDECEFAPCSWSGGTSKKLKVKSGWKGNGNGTDTHGFSAMPGGFRDYDGRFKDISAKGGWWTSYDDGWKFAFSMSYQSNEADGGVTDGGSQGFSVRCVQD